MSLKSRGRSPGGGGGQARHGDTSGRGGSLGPGHAGSSYSSEAEEGGGVALLDDSRQSSNNTSPSHTLGGGGGHGESNSIWYDEFDSSGLEPEKKQKALDLFQAKMNKTKEQIKHEQNSRDANVDEYLRLSSCADRHQLARIKQVFEKKNQKSAQTIAQLQKKLENYQKKVRDIEQGTLPNTSKPPKEVLKAVVNKPKEFAHLIRNKFGSADNIPKDGAWSDSGERVMAREGTPTHHRNHGHKRTQSGHVSSHAWNSHVKHGSASLPRDTTGSGGGSVPSDHRQSVDDSAASDVTSDSEHVPQDPPRHVNDTSRRPSGVNTTDRDPGHPQPWLQSIMDEIHERREECDKLARELEIQRQHFKQELEYLGGQLRDEAIRCERLEEQMNDLTELHQNEIENIKSGVTDMEEKVQYQSEERVRDIQEQLATLETRISRMEHQAAQHQQYVSIEGIENSNFKAIVIKGINVLLTLLQVLLLILATAAQILKPFLRTPTRVVTTVLLITVLVLAVRQWSEIKEFSVNFASRVKNPVDKDKTRDL